jgi:thioredoxin 1
MASEKVVTVNDSNFESEVLKSSVPVLVDFTASWCGPCRAIAPVIEGLAEEYQGRAKVAKLDVDDSPAIASRYGVRGVPTLIVIKGGQVVDQQVGAAPKARILALLERALV